jgi:hypothetical protein
MSINQPAKPLPFNRLINLSVVILFSVLTASAQNYLPRSYWTFDNPANVFSDSMNLFNMDPFYYQSGYSIGNNTPGTGVGKFLTLNASSGYIRLGSLPTDSAFTIEFLFRPGYNFKETRFFYRLDGAITAKMNYPYIVFTTTHRSYSGATVNDDLWIDLNGIGRKSYGYYIDGNWHHMVFKFNSNTGVKEIWVDGQCPAGFSKTVTPTGYFINNTSVNRDLLLNATIPYIQYHGDYDEMAIYSYGLPANMIYKHYLDFVANKHYSFANAAITVPPAAAVSGPIDLNEFPPGHPNVTVSVLDQLKTFPVPRYKQGHTMHPNFNWIDPLYTSGYMQPGVSNSQSVANSITLQTELVTKFNYMLYLGYSGSVWGDAWINLANQNPAWKASTVVVRAQLSNPVVFSQNLPNDHYLQNSSGQFIDLNGNVTSQKIWRPTAPTSSYTNDGIAMRNNLINSFQGKLTRPIDFVNENGEVFPMITNTALAKDPVVTAAKNASGLSWEEFLALKYKEHSTIPYRDQFMNLPFFNANTKYSEYRIDGHRTYQFRYEQTRFINTPINGKRYSTLDFYVKFPYNWRYWSGPWHGWQWVVESRKYEMALGDSLFSPFVAAGWDADNETHVRPAQYLGLLKCLGMIGAEFYYPAYFNLQSSYQPPNPPPNDPKGYIWQNVMPSYAQAITSRYEDLLRNGTILEGDVPNDPYNPQWNAYNFWTGDPQKIVVVRKSRTQNRYAITGTIQPNTNMAGNAALESTAIINLDGQQLKFKVRRQGSTYIYDKTIPSAPVFYQLDEWHEYKHPYLWTKDLNFEAENFETANSNVVIKTSVPAGTPAGDFTNFTSFLSFNAVADVNFNVEPRGTTPSNYYLWIRARSKNGTSTGVTVKLNGANPKTLDCIKDTAWTWYRFDNSGAPVVYPSLALQNHVLTLTPLNTNIEIDKFSLVTNSGAFYNNNVSPCSNVASISASGPTTFCQGGSVTLTASNGNSYLWSNGATTKSIIVSTSGTYTVTVTNNGIQSTSSPVTVTVNPLPTGFITAGGPTTFCSGGSVLLTSNSAQGYLWNPGGQTTQSIVVTSSGSYTVRVTDNNGCSNTSSPVVVTVNSAPVATITAGGPTTFCQGGSVTLTSSTGAAYLWNTGATTQSISATSSGNYSVRVTGSNGCSATSAQTTVTVNALPVASISANGPLNFNQGGSVVLTASAGSSYLWSPGNQTTQSITVTTSGTFTVRVTNSNGCSATSSPVTVTVNSGASYAIMPSGPTTFCQGGSVTLSLPSGTSYLWSTGATTQSIVVTTSGTYSATVYSGSNGVPAGPITVTVNPLPTATISPSGSTTICSGSSVQLTSSSGQAYLWTPGGQTTQSINVSTAGSYTVRVTNSYGCSATSAATVVSVISCSSCPIPTGLYTSNITSSYAQLNWTPLSGVSNFQVKIINVASGYTYTSGLFSGTLSSLTIAVQPNTKYRWRIRSYCNGVYSSWSNYNVFTTLPLRMGEPESIPIENFWTRSENDPEDLKGEIVESAFLDLWPNPVHQQFKISFNADEASQGLMIIRDFTGRIILISDIHINENLNSNEVNLPECSPGAYSIQIISNRKIYNARFIVQ